MVNWNCGLQVASYGLRGAHCGFKKESRDKIRSNLKIGTWRLEFGACNLVLGIWCLGFGACNLYTPLLDASVVTSRYLLPIVLSGK